MMAKTTGPRRLGALAATVVVYCVTMALAVAVAADCRIFELESPDPQTLRLKDGEHVIASKAITGGKVEVKVVVRGKDISPAQLYLGGKPMKLTAEDRVPKDIGECLGGNKRSAVFAPVDWLSSAARGLLDLVETPVEAFKGKCTYKCSCNQNTCCCLANCGGSTGVGCAGY